MTRRRRGGYSEAIDTSSKLRVIGRRRRGIPSAAMVKPLLDRAIADMTSLLPKLAALEPQLQRLCAAMDACWKKRGKVLIAGNGGSAADAMHFAEELTVRFMKNRCAFAAIALCDPTVITC